MALFGYFSKDSQYFGAVSFFCHNFLLLNPQIGQNIPKQLPDHRRRNGSSIIDALRIIDDTKSHHLRIVCRSKTNEGGNVFVGASGQCLRGGRLSSDAKACDVGIFSGKSF